ncbi:MAG: hypothetical protein FWD13_10340, partial [Treponema sp.]|nr:hypothetical protein [Treponema sp.]
SVPADTIIAQELSSASIAGRYVTVVMDKTPPGIWHTDLNAVITGGYLSSGIYTFSENAEMTITLNGLGSLSDNYGSGGISYTNAWNRPWTMDEHEHLRWRVLVYSGNPEDEVLRHDSIWMSMSENSYTKNVNDTGMNLSDDANARYTVTVQFIDRMGNVSDITQEAALRRTIRRTTDVAPIPVTGRTAACTETGENRLTQITVKWTLPNGMDGAELSVTGFDLEDKPRPLIPETINPLPGNIPQEHTFTVPATIITGVRDGHPVSNIIRYDINVVSYNAAGSASAEELTIWNIPGMDFTQTNTTLISTVAELQLINTIGLGSTNANRNFILVNDIELSAEWIPLGTTGAANTFHGKLYGNGHTITINSFTTIATSRVNLGLFNNVNNALIRELTVVYNTVIPANNNTLRFGGITAYASGTTRILNTIVNGNISTGELSASGSKNFGGITGWMSFTSVISNCFSAFNMNIITTGTNTIFFGGCVGETQGGGVVDENNRPTHTGLEGITVKANLRLSMEAGLMNAGGIVGRGRAAVENKFLEYSGNFTVIKTETGSSYIGGITGDCVIGVTTSPPNADHRIVYSNLRVSGSIVVPSSYMSDDNLFFGGFFGRSQRTIINDGIVTTDLRCDKAGTGGLYLGGLIGDLDQFSEMRNCRYEHGNIITGGEGLAVVGGGFGRVLQNSLVINCSSNASLLNVTRGNYHILVGGLIGDMTSSDINRCFAQTEIIAEGGEILSAGGLIGRWAVSSGNDEITYEVSECFATGNVSGFNTGNNSMCVGGLIAYISRSTGNAGLSLYNSYATGNVIADRRGGSNSTYAGGLVGYIIDTSATRIYNIRNNFATGNVNTKSAVVSNVFTGGLVGNITVTSGTANNLQNNAALGNSVTAMGSGATAARTGRIFGVSNINNNFNYARDNMRVEISGNYNDSFPSAMIFDTIAPVMTGTPVLSEIPAPVLNGTPVLQGSIAQKFVVISGLSISDISGYGLISAAIALAEINPVAAAYNNPSWNGNSITGLDLSGLSTTEHYLRLNLTLRNNAGCTSVYSIEVKPNRDIEERDPEEAPDFLTLSDFDVTVGSTPVINRIHSIGGIFISDEGGSGLANASMSAERNPVGGSSPIWNGNSITGIDLSGLTANNHYWRFDFTLQDNASNSSIYRIQVTRNAAGSFILSGPALQGTPVIVRSAASSQHGEAVTGSTFYNVNFWTRTIPNGLGFKTDNWNFNFLTRDGYPRLRWE